MRKLQYTIDFVNEYLRYAQDERIITDMDNQLGFPNYEIFVDHRHEQSILSLLSKKKTLKAFRDQSQDGHHVMRLYPNSKYCQLLESTRNRDKAALKKGLRKAKDKLRPYTKLFH